MNTDIKIIISAVDKGVKQAFTGLQTGFKRTNRAMTVFQQTLGKSNQAVSTFSRHLKALFAGVAISQLTRGFINVASSFEQLETKLDAITKGKGAETLEKINQWALDMPVNTQKAVDAFAMMSAYGLDPTIEKMETLVDVASIFGDDAMQRVSRAMGQMQTLGKLTAQDLNQLAEVGINARKYIKEAFDMTVEEAQKSGLEIEKIIGAIWKGMERDFGGAARATQDNWRGLWETVKSYLVEFQRMIAEAGFFEQLKEDLKAIKDRFEEMYKTGELKKWAGEVSDKLKQVWELIKTGLELIWKFKSAILGFAALSVSINVIGKMVTIFQALNAAIAVLTGTSIIAFLASLRTSLIAAATATTILGRAFQAVLIFAAAQAVYNIGLLIKALWDWRAAAKAAQQAQEDLASQSAWAEEKAAPALKELSKELGYTVKGLDHFNQLVKDGKIIFDDAAGKWVSAEKQKQAATEKTTEAVKASAKALEDFAAAAQKAYDKALSEAKKYADQVIEFEKKIQQARMSTEDKIRELSRKGLTEEQQWADKKLQAEEKLAQAKEALRQQDYEKAQKLAEQAQGLYADLAQEVKKETAEGEQVVAKTIEQTKKVAIAGVQEAGQVMEQIFGKQKSIAADMQTQWEEAATKIKELMDLVNQAADSKIEISAEGLEAIKSEIEALVSEPKTVNVTADTTQAKTELVQLEDGTWTEITVRADADTSKAKTELQSLKRLGDGMEMTAKVTAKTAAAQKAINEIKQALASIKDKTVTVTVIQKVKKVQEKALGGIVQALAAGGKLFGYGGGDKIKAMLEAGEFVIRKEAVAKYGSFLFNALNSMRIPQDQLAEVLNRKAFAAGGMVTPTEAITLTINAGSASAPLTVTGSPKVTRGMILEIERELRKMGMTK